MLYDKAYMIVKIFATAVVMVFNFITRKLFLEKRTKEKKKQRVFV